MAVRPMQEMCQFAKFVSNVIDVTRYLYAMLEIINIYFTLFYSSKMYSDQPDMLPQAVFKKISKVHNNGMVLQLIEPSECRRGGKALQLLRILQLKDTVMEMMTSKVFIECKNFIFMVRL